MLKNCPGYKPIYLFQSNDEIPATGKHSLCVGFSFNKVVCLMITMAMIT